jgi:A/G-specific adenine glycosylase
LNPDRNTSLYDSANPDNIIFFQKTLLRWFRKNKRRYPWRLQNDPFKILIAEMMLQRTRAEQVAPVYTAFIRKFPDPKSVLFARLDDISQYFSKLGLFWRIALLRQMADHIVTHYQGNVPERKDELVTIPGIGDYISDTLVVFAFNRRRTIIDSNVVRVVRLATRYFGIPSKGEMRRNRMFREFCQKLTYGLKHKTVKNFNWGLLDHSATICKPVPLCEKCPLSRKCRYYKIREAI